MHVSCAYHPSYHSAIDCAPVDIQRRNAKVLVWQAARDPRRPTSVNPQCPRIASQIHQQVHQAFQLPLCETQLRTQDGISITYLVTQCLWEKHDLASVRSPHDPALQMNFLYLLLLPVCTCRRSYQHVRQMYLVRKASTRCAFPSEYLPSSPSLPPSSLSPSPTKASIAPIAMTPSPPFHPLLPSPSTTTSSASTPAPPSPPPASRGNPRPRRPRRLQTQTPPAIGALARNAHSRNPPASAG